MQPIVFGKSPLTWQEYSALNWKIVWKTRRWRFGFILLIPVLLSVSVLQNPDATMPAPLRLLPALIMPAVLAGWLYFAFHKQFRNNYRNFPAFAEGATHTLTETDVSLASASTMSKQPWAPFYKEAMLVDQWIVLYASPITGYLLDLRKLMAPATLADVAVLFQSKGITLKK